MKEKSVVDEQRIKRLKKICLSSVYTCSGDIYKLLDSKNLQNLVKNIDNGNIQLPSELVYGRKIITKEEKFIENLDKYICFVKDFCHIDIMEQNLIIETTLNNKYSKILYSLEDYYQEKGFNKYLTEFMKMLWFNLYDNIVFFFKYADKDSAIKTFLNNIENLDFDKNISDLDKIFTQIINNRKNNLYNSFLHHTEYDERHYDFYINQINWLLEDYYKDKIVDSFDIRNIDHSVFVNKTYILFSINGNIKKAKERDGITVSFGMKNKHFNAMITDELFEKKEFLRLLDTFKLVKKNKEVTQRMDFINPILVFKFIYDDEHQWLDIKYKHDYSNSDDYYSLELDKDEIIKLYTLINSHLQ